MDFGQRIRYLREKRGMNTLKIIQKDIKLVPLID